MGKSIECKGLIFDLDGTLVDSGEVVEKVWKMFADRYGFDFEKQVLPICHGRPAKYPLKELLPRVTEEEMDAVEDEFNAIEMTMLEELKPIRGADILLPILPPGKWAIATSGDNNLASGRLKSAGLPIPKHFVTAGMYKNSKPHPDPFLMAAQSLGFEPEDCIVFEDSPAGIEGAKTAGCTVIGINLVEAAKKVSKPDYVINDMTEIRVSYEKDSFKIEFLKTIRR